MLGFESIPGAIDIEAEAAKIREKWSEQVRLQRLYGGEAKDYTPDKRERWTPPVIESRSIIEAARAQ